MDTEYVTTAEALDLGVHEQQLQRGQVELRGRGGPGSLAREAAARLATGQNRLAPALALIRGRVRVRVRGRSRVRVRVSVRARVSVSVRVRV